MQGIIEAAALGRADDIRVEEALAVLQNANGTPTGIEVEREISQILTGLCDCLATFKHPRFFLFVDSFPRTASNKVQKEALGTAINELPIYDAVKAIWIST